MVQNTQEDQYMLLVAPNLGLSNIIEDHIPDFFAPLLA
jgi:hypothetical protein